MGCGCRRAGAADQGGRDTDATLKAGPKFTPLVGRANGQFQAGRMAPSSCLNQRWRCSSKFTISSSDAFSCILGGVKRLVCPETQFHGIRGVLG